MHKGRRRRRKSSAKQGTREEAEGKPRKAAIFAAVGALTWTDGTPCLRRYPEKILVLSLSPKETSESRDLGVRSLRRDRPTRSMVSSSSSAMTSSQVSWSTSSSARVASCSSRIFLSGSSSFTSLALHNTACSPAIIKLFVVLPIALRTTTGASFSNRHTILATWRIRSASATEEPPNL